MKTELQYAEAIDKYYSRLWRLPIKQVREFVKLYELSHRIWRYKKFKEWLRVAYGFILTAKKYRNFVKYYKIHKRRIYLKLPHNVKITKTFIVEALKKDRTTKWDYL